MFKWFGKTLSTLRAILTWFLRYLTQKGTSPPPPPPPPPPAPKLIPDDPAHVPTGPNLLRNGSFETGVFGAGTQRLVDSGGVIDDWGTTNGVRVRWIDAADPFLSPASNGQRFLDLSADGQVQGKVFQTWDYFGSAQSAPVVRRYECAVDLGVGPALGYGPPITVVVRVLTLKLLQVLKFNPPAPASGIVWQRFSFRFEIPAGYVVPPPPNHSFEIEGTQGDRLIGVDNATLHLLT